MRAVSELVQQGYSRARPTVGKYTFVQHNSVHKQLCSSSCYELVEFQTRMQAKGGGQVVPKSSFWLARE